MSGRTLCGKRLQVSELVHDVLSLRCEDLAVRAVKLALKLLPRGQHGFTAGVWILRGQRFKHASGCYI